VLAHIHEGLVGWHHLVNINKVLNPAADRLQKSERFFFSDGLLSTTPKSPVTIHDIWNNITDTKPENRREKTLLSLAEKIKLSDTKFI